MDQERHQEDPYGVVRHRVRLVHDHPPQEDQTVEEVGVVPWKWGEECLAPEVLRFLDPLMSPTPD